MTKGKWSVNKSLIEKTYARWHYLARRIPDRRTYNQWSVNNSIQELTHHRRQHERIGLWLKVLLVLYFSVGIVAWMAVIVWVIKSLFL
jgi:hypothetical protein